MRVAALPEAALPTRARGLSFFFLVALLEARPLQAPKLRADPHRLQEVGDGLGDRHVHHVAEDFAGVEAPGVAGLRQELPGASRIVRVRRCDPGEVEILRNDARADFAEAEILRLVDGLPVDRQVGGQAHTPTGAFLKPSSPSRSTYLFGRIQAAPVAGVA